MKLNKTQSQAIEKIDDWEKFPSKHEWLFTMAGFAGTGKTTILAEYIRSLAKWKYHCCAPTGKAASVLRSKLKGDGVFVQTAHQLLYTPVGPKMEKLNQLQQSLEEAKGEEKPLAGILLAIKEEKERLAVDKVRFNLKVNPQLEGKVVIVDEASMVSEQMRADFRVAGARCLFVGDPGQLPPVKESGWFIDQKHDVMLKDIVRQALKSPIIKLSMEIREMTANPGSYTDLETCAIISKEQMPPELWAQADQVITGSNKSRFKLNRFFRKQLGRSESELPLAGDKLICLKNDHYQLPEPWINGVQCLATDDTSDPGDGILWLNTDYGGHQQQLELYPNFLWANYREVEHEPVDMRKGMFEADYAYAITCHKSQGSEWGFVIVADDKMQFDNKEFRKRWLYTAATRAKNRLIIVQ